LNELRIAFAGDRDIAVWVLDFVLSQGVSPLALMVPDEARASHVHELRDRCKHLSENNILVGTSFRTPAGIEKLRALELDYILGIHFPYLVPKEVLSVSKHGILNLHPAYLPFNRGWHTPTWVILQGTPAGATLHFMDSGIDTGDIIHQKQLHVAEDDTADTLYKRLKKLELEVFQEAWPQLITCNFSRTPQKSNDEAYHKCKDLFQGQVQRVNLDEPTTARQLINRLRALTTNRIDEAAYFEVDGERFRVQLVIATEGRHRER
jgi:methionyl-tRNA formyltransferase